MKVKRRRKQQHNLKLLTELYQKEGKQQELLHSSDSLPQVEDIQLPVSGILSGHHSS